MCQGKFPYLVIISGVFNPFSFWENFPVIEVELKVRADLQKVRKRLQDLGAFLKGFEVEEDLYFNSPWRDFSQSDEALRIRIRGKGGILTYKGPKLDSLSKTREEIEVEVSDWHETKRLLLKLGFKEVGRVRKWRERYELGELVVSLDRVEGLGEFVEVEAKAEGNYSRLLRKALELLEILGVSEEPIRESYLEMLLAKKLFDKHQARG